MVPNNILKEISEKLLSEDLKNISPQQARDLKLFGPVFHGTTSDKLEKINTQGFNVFVGHERSGNVSQGYEASDYYGGIPAPIHHLGFGVYFTTVQAIAKRFGEGNPNTGPYFLDIPKIETINFGSPRTMMKWWEQNGYDYKKTPQTTFGNPETNLNAIRQERLRATIQMTNFLKSRYDGVWFKGKGMYKLLDGDQVVIFDPSKVYKLDKNLAQPGEIGSRVVAKVGIDPFGRGEIKVPMGTKGTILDKRKPDERQTWAKGSEWIYSIKWDKGGKMWDILDSWIQPYVKPTSKKLNEAILGDCRNEELVDDIFGHVSEFNRQVEIHGDNFKYQGINVSYDPNTDIHTFWTEDKLKENLVQRRNFWKMYEESLNQPTPPTISLTKKEEQEVVRHIILRWSKQLADSGLKNSITDLRKTIKKIDPTTYKAIINDAPIIFEISRNKQGVGYITRDEKHGYIWDWTLVVPASHHPLTETEDDPESTYSPMTKVEEEQVVRYISGELKRWGYGLKGLIKIKDERKLYDIEKPYDRVEYKFDNPTAKHLTILLSKIGHKFWWAIKSENEKPEASRTWWPFPSRREHTAKLKENDGDHGAALQQTGYWGRQGAGAIILAQDTGRILLPYRSRSVEQPHTWGVWGGAIDAGEDPATAVRREISEEVGYEGLNMELIPMYVYQDPKVGFQYNNFLAVVPKEFVPRLNWETENYRWTTYGEWPSPIHFGLKALLQNSGDEILKVVQKYNKETPSEQPKQMDKAKYAAAIHIIRMTWADMAKNGDYQDRFDFDNNFVHWMQNTQPLNALLEKYGQMFYPQAHEPHYEFQDDVEKVLEMLEEKHNERRTRKVNKNDPLYFLKQTVRGKSWRGAKQSLNNLSWVGRGRKLGQITDDMAESLFNRLYRVSLGETFYDADAYKYAVYLDKYILSANTDDSMRNFIQHYNGRKTDRFPASVKVWRGLNSPTSKIRPGDYVTFDKGYARSYGAGKYAAVVSDILPSKDLIVTKPDSESSEMIYWPPGHQIKKVENVPSFKQFYNQWAFP